MFASYIVSRTVSPLCCSGPAAHTEAATRPNAARADSSVGAALGRRRPCGWFITRIPWGLRTAERGRRRGDGCSGRSPRSAVGGIVLSGFFCCCGSPRFDRLFERFTNSYERLLAFCLAHRWVVVVCWSPTVPGSLAFRAPGRSCSPRWTPASSPFTCVSPAGRASRRPSGRSRQSRSIIRGDTEANVPGVVAPGRPEMMLSNIGLSSRWSAIYTPNNGPHAAAIRVQLRSGFAGREARRSTTSSVCASGWRRIPVHDFFFETGGMIRRILNAGPWRRSRCRSTAATTRCAGLRRRLNSRLSAARRPGHLSAAGHGPAAADHQRRSQPGRPAVRLHRERRDAQRVHGADVQRQIAPNFWIDRSSGNHYLIGVQYPEHAVRSIHAGGDPDLGGANRPGTGNVRKLKEMATIERRRDRSRFSGTRANRSASST